MFDCLERKKKSITNRTFAPDVVCHSRRCILAREENIVHVWEITEGGDVVAKDEFELDFIPLSMWLVDDGRAFVACDLINDRSKLLPFLEGVLKVCDIDSKKELHSLKLPLVHQHHTKQSGNSFAFESGFYEAVENKYLEYDRPNIHSVSSCGRYFLGSGSGVFDAKTFQLVKVGNPTFVGHCGKS